MDFLLLGLMLANTLLTAYALHKVRKIHLATFRLERDLAYNTAQFEPTYAQVTAFHDLHQLIEPVKPLPPLRGWAASPDFLLEIAQYALDSKPLTILECSSGASTIVLARCCQLLGQGHVYSLEHDEVYAEKSRQELARHGLGDFASVINAPLVPTPSVDGQQWYSLEELPSSVTDVGLLVIDGPPKSTAPLARYPALPILRDRLANECVIFLDDANRAAEQEMLRQWSEEFPEVEQAMLPLELGAARLKLVS